jgi:TolA-binding protein
VVPTDIEFISPSGAQIKGNWQHKKREEVSKFYLTGNGDLSSPAAPKPDHEVQRQMTTVQNQMGTMQNQIDSMQIQMHKMKNQIDSMQNHMQDQMQRILTLLQSKVRPANPKSEDNL